jgi:SSS family solute:Na+ symporter
VAVTRIGIAVGIIVAIVLGKAVRGNIIALATAIFFGLCGASFLPMFIGALFWKRMTKAAAVASMLTGFCVSLFWLVFMNAKVAGGLGFCRALFGRTTLVPDGWSVTWNVVDPLLVALPASAVVAVLVSLLTPPMDEEHVEYCFGGPEPERE